MDFDGQVALVTGGGKDWSAVVLLPESVVMGLELSFGHGVSMLKMPDE